MYVSGTKKDYVRDMFHECPDFLLIFQIMAVESTLCRTNSARRVRITALTRVLFLPAAVLIPLIPDQVQLEQCFQDFNKLSILEHLVFFPCRNLASGTYL